ncbi:MAG: lipoprotein insertase outer membrane protein LolB [Gammaproteobacteria bacterium]
MLVAGCAALREPAPVAMPEQAWRQRVQQLLRLDSWSLTGRIALRADEQAWHASVHWIQRGDHYRIRIRGPLGVGAMELSGGPEGVVLRTSKEERFAADAPEKLLREIAGWSMPVSGLRYWLLGVSDQDAAIDGMQLDGGGRLESLRQGGWAIEYLGYDQVEGVQLPAKLYLQSSKISARIAINNWVLES